MSMKPDTLQVVSDLAETSGSSFSLAETVIPVVKVLQWHPI